MKKRKIPEGLPLRLVIVGAIALGLFQHAVKSVIVEGAQRFKKQKKVP
jgi:hypothetical protein